MKTYFLTTKEVCMKSRGQRSRRIFPFVSLLILAGLLAACSSGGGDEDVAPAAPATLTVTGTAVSSNNGSLAKAAPRQGLRQWFASLFVTESYAQAVGLGPVANARVVAFKINNDGTVQTSAANPTGIIAESTTNAGGFFQVTLPAGYNPSSDLIVQVSNAAAGTPPAPINSLNVINAPVAQNVARTDQVLGRIINLDLTPGTEVATREMLAKVQGTGGTLANFTTQETSAFVGMVAGTSIGITSTTLPATINAIQTQLQPVITESLNLIAPPGTVNQSALSGTYAVARYFAGLDIGNSRTGRYVQAGTATLDGMTGTFTLPFSEQGSYLGEICGGGGNLCQRTFMTTLTLDRTDIITGSFLYLPSTHQIVLTNSFGETTVAPTNPDATVVLLPYVDGRRGISLGFGLAIKKGAGITAADLSGIFNFRQFGSDISPGNSYTGSWPSPINSYTGTGTVTFGPSNNVTISGNGSAMTMTVNCTPGGTSGCSISGALGIDPLPVNIAGTFSVASDGSFSITNPGPPPESNTGVLGSDKALAMVPIQDNFGGAVAIVSKKSSGLSNASLDGAYSVLFFREIQDTLGHLVTLLYAGTITFDGSGSHTLAAKGYSADLAEDCQGGVCGFHVSSNVLSTPTDVNLSGTYSVTQATNEASVTVSGLGTFTGFAVPNAAGTAGTFLFATESFDSQARPGGGQRSGRTLALFVKQ